MTIKRDKTYCGSPTCQNKCGRKPTEEDQRFFDDHLNRYGQHAPVWWAYFCDENGEYMDEGT